MVKQQTWKIRSILVPLVWMVVGCGSPPAKNVVIPTGKGNPVDPAADDPGIASVISVALPSSFVVDGEIREWGSLDPSKKPVEKGKAPDKPTPVPPSHMAIAVHPKGLALAAELTKGMGDSIVVGLAFDRPEVPSIGYFMRGGGIMPLPCVNEENAATMDPKERDSCQKVLNAHDAFANEYYERFRMLVRIQSKGVSVFRGIKWDDVPEAKVAMKPTKSGHTLEVDLPAKVLPRTQQAPVSGLFAYAEANKTDKPAYRQDDAWDMLSIKDPVGFEPLAELREVVFGRASAFQVSYRPYKPNNISYQPGDALEVEDVDYQGGSETVATFSNILYSKQATKGDVEVGYPYVGRAPPGSGGLAPVLSLYKGKPVQAEVLMGEHQKIVERDGELHVIAYWRFEPNDPPGETAEWNIAAVGQDGQMRLDIVERGGLPSQGFFSVSQFANDDYSVFGVMGTPADGDLTKDFAAFHWKYNSKEHYYEFALGTGDEPAKKATKKPKKK